VHGRAALQLYRDLVSVVYDLLHVKSRISPTYATADSRLAHALVELLRDCPVPGPHVEEEDDEEEEEAEAFEHAGPPASPWRAILCNLGGTAGSVHMDRIEALSAWIPHLSNRLSDLLTGWETCQAIPAADREAYGGGRGYRDNFDGDQIHRLLKIVDGTMASTYLVRHRTPMRCADLVFRALDRRNGLLFDGCPETGGPIAAVAVLGPYMYVAAPACHRHALLAAYPSLSGDRTQASGR
jgi:hypothetical protein